MFHLLKFAIFATNRRFFAWSLKFSGLSIVIPLPLHRISEKTASRGVRILSPRSQCIMVNQPNSTPINGVINQTDPKQPLPRTWFMARGYKQADTRYTNGFPVWLHPHTNDVLSSYGQKLQLQEMPDEKFRANTTRYLKLGRGYGNMYLARLKYLTFVGPIKEGEVIDHIDGNTMNNDIDNLRAIPPEINSRDGGFMKKLRNNGIIVAMFPNEIILAGYERMAKWKATHSLYQYYRLKGQELLQVFFGPNYKVVDPTIAAGEEPNKYV